MTMLTYMYAHMYIPASCHESEERNVCIGITPLSTAVRNVEDNYSVLVATI